MLGRRKRDTVCSVNGLPNSGSLSAPESPASDTVLDKFRDITSALLEAVWDFTEGSGGKMIVRHLRQS